MREIKFRVWYTDEKKFDEAIMDFDKLDHWVYDIKRPYAVYMQYTGLKDKNGTDVYEGDIIDGLRVVIEPQSTGLRDKANKWQGQIAHRATGLEVIGNIYEHPELLK